MIASAAVVWALGFAHPAFLLATALAAAPIIIHLLNRRRFRPVEWAAMEFLRRAHQRNRRRLRLEQVILLAVRTLLVLLFVLGLARPYVAGPLAAGPLAVPTHRVLVIDGSFSMQYGSGRRALFEQAREAARAVLATANPGDAANLILMATPVRAVIREASEDLATVRQELDSLQPTHTPADLAPTLQAVLEALDSSRLRHKEVTLITDCQRRTFRDAGPNAPTRSAVRELVRRIAEQARLTVVDVGQPEAANLAVTDLRLASPVATVGRPTAVEAVVRRFGRHDAAPLAVELWVDGSPAGRQTVRVTAGQEQGVTFHQTFSTGGDRTVEVRLPGDDLTVDDRRHLAVDVRSHVDVLCINGEPNPDPVRSETFFLEAALEPRPDLSALRAHVASESALLEQDLGRYAVVVLANVGRLTANEAQLLQTYLQAGGGLLVFLGDQVDATTYNEHLYQDGRGPLPARLAERRGGRPGAEPERFDPLGYRHPVIAEFKGFERAGLLTARTAIRYRLEVSDHDRRTGARVVLGFADGSPAIVAKPFGRGRVAMVATSADDEWTTLPAKPSFLPIVHNLIHHLIEGQAVAQNSRVGEPIVLVLPITCAEAAVRVTPPAGSAAAGLIRARAEGAVAAARFGDTLAAGIYRLDVGPPLNRTKLFAVNVDPEESDLDKLQREEVVAALEPAPLTYVTSWQDLVQGPVETDRPSDLYRYCFLGVLLLVVTESLLAWKFGHWRQT